MKKWHHQIGSLEINVHHWIFGISSMDAHVSSAYMKARDSSRLCSVEEWPEWSRR